MADMIDDEAQLVRILFLMFEFYVFFMTLAGNFLFLAFRMLLPNQVTMTYIEPQKQMASTDSIEAMSQLLSQYQGFVIPFLVSAYCLFTNIRDGTPPAMLRNVKDFLYFQAIQVFCVHFLIFVSWKKGPKWWLKIAPTLFMGMIVLTYILIPIGICILTDLRWESFQDDIFFLQLFVSFGC